MKNKSVIITGASRGIGEAAARKFAQLGAKVLLCARSSAAIETIAAEINAAGGTARALATDVADYDQVQAAIEFAKSEFGSVDILINNAGMLEPVERLEHATVDAWDTIIDVNVKGVFYGIRAALPIMKTAGGGTIITIGSGAATSALEGWSHYNTSKAAVHHLSACLHGEEGENGIRALVLSPGTVATQMQRIIKKSGVNPVSNLEWEDHRHPSVIADTLVWMCTPDADDFLGDVVRQSDPEILARLGQK
ncbi:MAG: SDR family oxidoreductase [Amylibacter sp.]|jgi:NADP-dependent 3-hydroxy acid dehydrogenase YdfG|nr:SDR family oxidoreductase [Amylibacter sp.]